MPSTMVALLTCTSLNRTKPSPNFSSPRLYYGGFQWYYFMSFIKMYQVSRFFLSSLASKEMLMYIRQPLNLYWRHLVSNKVEEWRVPLQCRDAREQHQIDVYFPTNAVLDWLIVMYKDPWAVVPPLCDNLETEKRGEKASKDFVNIPLIWYTMCMSTSAIEKNIP